jgi:hypothetical protein
MTSGMGLSIVFSIKRRLTDSAIKENIGPSWPTQKSHKVLMDEAKTRIQCKIAGVVVSLEEVEWIQGQPIFSDGS